MFIVSAPNLLVLCMIYGRGKGKLWLIGQEVTCGLIPGRKWSVRYKILEVVIYFPRTLPPLDPV